jgi:cytochrome d ubiquinol oxidase subunit I
LEGPTLIARLQFAVTIVYHYLFPQLTMGLALLLVALKTLYLRRADETYNKAVRFWGKIFAITFVMGVITGIPMEFQFGTNWAAFSAFAGDIIAQTLTMEGAFAFFLESAFLAIFLFGERRFGQKMHWLSAFMLLIGTLASAYFSLATNAWMQNPVGYEEVAGGGVWISDYWAVLLNPLVFVQFAHNQGGTVVTAAFVMTGLGTYYLLARRDEHYGRRFVRVGLVAGVIASGWMLLGQRALRSLRSQRGCPLHLFPLQPHPQGRQL